MLSITVVYSRKPQGSQRRGARHDVAYGEGQRIHRFMKYRGKTSALRWAYCPESAQACRSARENKRGPGVGQRKRGFPRSCPAHCVAMSGARGETNAAPEAKRAGFPSCVARPEGSRSCGTRRGAVFGVGPRKPKACGAGSVTLLAFLEWDKSQALAVAYLMHTLSKWSNNTNQ